MYLLDHPIHTQHYLSIHFVFSLGKDIIYKCFYSRVRREKPGFLTVATEQDLKDEKTTKILTKLESYVYAWPFSISSAAISSASGLFSSNVVSFVSSPLWRNDLFINVSIGLARTETSFSFSQRYDSHTSQTAAYSFVDGQSSENWN